MMWDSLSILPPWKEVEHRFHDYFHALTLDVVVEWRSSNVDAKNTNLLIACSPHNSISIEMLVQMYTNSSTCFWSVSIESSRLPEDAPGPTK